MSGNHSTNPYEPEGIARSDDHIANLKITDVDATRKLIENMLAGAEYNETKNMQTVGVRTKGFMLMNHYDFTDMFQATLCYRRKVALSPLPVQKITGALAIQLTCLVEISESLLVSPHVMECASTL